MSCNLIPGLHLPTDTIIHYPKGKIIISLRKAVCTIVETVSREYRIEWRCISVNFPHPCNTVIWLNNKTVYAIMQRKTLLKYRIAYHDCFQSEACIAGA